MTGLTESSSSGLHPSQFYLKSHIITRWGWTCNILNLFFVTNFHSGSLTDSICTAYENKVLRSPGSASKRNGGKMSGCETPTNPEPLKNASSTTPVGNLTTMLGGKKLLACKFLIFSIFHQHFCWLCLPIAEKKIRSIFTLQNNEKSNSLLIYTFLHRIAPEYENSDVERNSDESHGRLGFRRNRNRIFLRRLPKRRSQNQVAFGLERFRAGEWKIVHVLEGNVAAALSILFYFCITIAFELSK